MPRARPNGDAPQTSSMRSAPISINDDKEEKAARLQSRQAQHMRQMNQLRAAATSPHRKRKSLTGSAPPTPSQDAELYDVRGEGITPQKRVPLLANFEEWMKLATDNKINATNSWNFALIDYFHDMSLLKDGDGVNFQKASCTLDGCVKIYTSRVDSVATETGKLLSGLADSRQRKRQQGEEEGEEGEEGAEGEEGTRKKKSRAKRSAEATLVNSFDQLRLKKMELEFSVDPLFKKASADFDEGGAKGLLLNHLSIDSSGRIVFDSSDDVKDEDEDESRRDSMEPEIHADEVDKPIVEDPVSEDLDAQIMALGSRFLPDMDILDAQDICPSLKTFTLGSGDTSLNLPFMKAPDNWREEQETVESIRHKESSNVGDLPDGDDDDNGGDAGGGWDTHDIGFGEGGEVWARDAALQPQMRVLESSADGNQDEEVGTFDANSSTYAITLQHNRSQDEQDNILNYFDTANQKNWAGPEHWKIARVKDTQRAGSVEKPRQRKEKEVFEIGFAAPMSAEMATALYTTASSNSVISLPKKEWKSRNRNLLPDDKHFNSKDLLTLFLKPKARLGARKPSQTAKIPTLNGEVDEAYWANAYHGGATEEEMARGDYDANFFAEDNLRMADADINDDDIFADARERLSPAVDGQVEIGSNGLGIDGVVDGSGETQGAFGVHLITQNRRMRPQYVQYARVAKKVDVRRLKEEIWRGSGLTSRVHQSSEDNDSAAPKPTVQPDADQSGFFRFTDIMNNLRNVYPKQQLADISTSYGFICLLHLANEKGLVVENVEGFEDLRVRKDPSVLAPDQC